MYLKPFDEQEITRILKKNIPEIETVEIRKDYRVEEEKIAPNRYENPKVVVCTLDMYVDFLNGNGYHNKFNHNTCEISVDGDHNLMLDEKAFLAEVIEDIKKDSYLYLDIPQESGGVKFDDGKLRMDLITPEMLESMAEVLTMGSKKYGDRNWEQGIDPDRLYAACMRHLNTWRKGTDLDDESGLHHVKHAMVNLGMLVTFIERGK